MLYSKHGLVMHLGPLDLTCLKDGLENLSTEGIIYECLGFKVELKEEIRTSDRSQEKLSDDQVLYACVESYCALNCGVKLNLWFYAWVDQVLFASNISLVFYMLMIKVVIWKTYKMLMNFFLLIPLWF
jgi:hypothetical protein